VLAEIPALSCWLEFFLRMTVQARPNGHDHYSSKPKRFLRGFPSTHRFGLLAAAIFGKSQFSVLFAMPLTKLTPEDAGAIRTFNGFFGLNRLRQQYAKFCFSPTACTSAIPDSCCFRV
jgi:hypothetical protein